MAYLGGGRDQALRQTFYFLATAGQTVFSGPDQNGFSLNYRPGFINVRINGLDAVPGVDYTATNGSSITIATPLTALDVVTVEAFGVFSLSDSFIKSENFADVPNKATAKSNLTVPAWKPVPGYDPWIVPSESPAIVFAVVPVPAGARAMRGKINVATASVAANNTIFMRASNDNGATFKSAATDYTGHYIFQSGGTVTAATGQQLGYLLTGLASSAPAIPQVIDLELTFSFPANAAVPVMKSSCQGNDASGLSYIIRSGYFNMHGITHLYFGTLNAQTMRTGSYIELEYI